MSQRRRSLRGWQPPFGNINSLVRLGRPASFGAGRVSGGDNGYAQMLARPFASNLVGAMGIKPSSLD